jgi:hypothetical protein
MKTAPQPIRASDNRGNLVAAIAGFLKAKETNPRIITCSWGGDEEYPPPGPPNQMDLAIAAEIQDAIHRGILVIFSAGNGQFSVEPQVPGVLAAGGVFADQSGVCVPPTTRAAIKVSGSTARWFPPYAAWLGCSLERSTLCYLCRQPARSTGKRPRRPAMTRPMAPLAMTAGHYFPAHRLRRLSLPARPRSS